MNNSHQKYYQSWKCRYTYLDFVYDHTEPIKINFDESRIFLTNSQRWPSLKNSARASQPLEQNGADCKLSYGQNVAINNSLNRVINKNCRCLFTAARIAVCVHSSMPFFISYHARLLSVAFQNECLYTALPLAEHLPLTTIDFYMRDKHGEIQIGYCFKQKINKKRKWKLTKRIAQCTLSCTTHVPPTQKGYYTSKIYKSSTTFQYVRHVSVYSNSYFQLLCRV